MKLKVIERTPVVLVTSYYDNEDYYARVTNFTHQEEGVPEDYVSDTRYYVAHKHQPKLRKLREVDWETFHLIFPEANGPMGWNTREQTPQYTDMATYWDKEILTPTDAL